MDVDENEVQDVANDEEPSAVYPEDEELRAAPPDVEMLNPKRRILPNTAAYDLYHKWTTIVPGLVEEYLRYMNMTIGKPVGPGCSSEIFRSECSCGHLRVKISSLTCLFYDRECLYALN